MLRLTFHDAFGEGTRPDGCLDPNEADHNGLSAVRRAIDPICARHAAHLSRADCWVLAGNVAIQAAGGAAVPFRYGRTDSAACNDAGMLPSAKPAGNPWHHIIAVFHRRARFSIREIVALMGAHSLGRPSSDPSDKSGFTALPWVRGNGGTSNIGGSFLTTSFYSSISGVPWTKSRTVDGEWLHARPGEAADTMMLDTDMALAVDTSTCSANNGRVRFGGGGGGGGKGGRGGFNSNPSNAGGCAFNALPFEEVRRYAEQPSAWRAEFTAAVQKMSEMSYSSWETSLSNGGPIVSTTLCTVTATSTGCGGGDAVVVGSSSPVAAPSVAPAMSPGQDSTLGDSDSSDDGSRRRRSGSMGRRRTDSGDGGSSAVGRRRRSSVNFDASQIDVALEYVTQLVGTEYERWAGGNISAASPAWAANTPPPAVESIRSTSIFCAGIPNLMLRVIGGTIPCLTQSDPDAECGQCCGGTGAYYQHYKSVAVPFDIQTVYPRGTLLGRAYQSVDHQGHTAVLLGNGSDSMLLQSYGSAGVTANITLRQAYNSLPFCRFTYVVLPRDWLIGTAQPTLAPTTPQGTGTVALTTVTHTVAVATLEQADYTGDLKLAYEVGYGAYLGIYNLSAARFEPNCSVTSSVNPRR